MGVVDCASRKMGFCLGTAAANTRQQRLMERPLCQTAMLRVALKTLLALTSLSRGVRIQFACVTPVTTVYECLPTAVCGRRVLLDSAEPLFSFMKLAFVTVGTTKFEDLVRAVDSDDVLDALRAKGKAV